MKGVLAEGKQVVTLVPAKLNEPFASMQVPSKVCYGISSIEVELMAM
jgi:hypothetical protein